MPIEIKELVIRAVLVSAGDDAAPADGSSTGPGAALPSATDPLATELIVQECVRQVLRILARQQER